MENDIRSKGNIAKKVLKIVLKILYQLLIILCVILTIIIVMQKFTNSNRTILGFRIFRVITGSMEPEYDVGVVVICKEVPANEIEVGNDIVYLGTYGDYSGKIIMHEVVGIDKDEAGNSVNFHAKGLHSASVEDPQIDPSRVFGVVKHQSGILTKLYELATSIYSAFIIITILVLNVFISFKMPGNKKVNTLEERYEEDYEEETEEFEYEEQAKDAEYDEEEIEYDEEEIEEDEEIEESDEPDEK